MLSLFESKKLLLTIQRGMLDLTLSMPNISIGMQILEIKQKIKDCAPSEEIRRRSLAGQLSGLMKNWRGLVIVNITEFIFTPESIGREQARRWQKRAFGRSINSASLKLYGVADRAGGGRCQEISCNTEAMTHIKDFYAACIGAMQHLEKPIPIEQADSTAQIKRLLSISTGTYTK